MLNAPCKDCTARAHNCHSSCEAYKTYKRRLDEQNEKRRRKKKEETDIWVTHTRGNTRRRIHV